jgi:hypothetical protein
MCGQATDVGTIPTSFRGATIDSSQTVLCTVPQLSACGKFNNDFDATGSKRVAQNTQVEQRGLMRFRIADFRSEYKLTVEKRKREFLLCYTEMSI